LSKLVPALPAGTVSILPAGRETGQRLVASPDVDHVAFTGSTAAGRSIAAVCGRDLRRGEAIARQVRTGMIGVNGFRPDFSMPFGGIKASGIGREFGREGLDAYTEPKALYRPVPA
jgi:acyl-CoA reductase-like NAD-dependent aldehyde dehydrogenase